MTVAFGVGPPRPAQQRTREDDAVLIIKESHRLDSAQTISTTATKQIQHNRLRLIVHRVRDDNHLSALLARNLRQKIVSSTAGRLLQIISALAGALLHIYTC